jgi:hypothetical protein
MAHQSAAAAAAADDDDDTAETLPHRHCFLPAINNNKLDEHFPPD